MVRYTMAPEAVKLAVGLLEDGFELRDAASEAFPPEVTSSHIRATVTTYEDEDDRYISEIYMLLMRQVRRRTTDLRD
jgi:hypothetical protein